MSAGNDLKGHAVYKYEMPLHSAVLQSTVVQITLSNQVSSVT